jgi:hypothetical protein
VSRNDRNRPLPEIRPARVEDQITQRAFDVVWNALGEVIRFLQPFVQRERWQTVEYQTGWGDFSRLVFKKDPLGEVRLQGSAQRTSGSGTVICVLPIGYRPAERLFFGSVNYSGVAYTTARVDVDVDGRVIVASGDTDFVPLQHIRFEAA